jgi:hypothetical protein
MRKRTVKILTGIGITIVALGVIYAIAVGVSSAKLRRAYAELKKDGRPMSQAEIIPPKVPDDENAAPLYESVALLLKAQPAPNGNLLDYLRGSYDGFMNGSLEPDKLTEFKQLIDQDVVTQALAIVEQGTRRKSCRFDHDYMAGFNMLMPHLAGLRDLVRLIGARSCLEAEAGRSDAAWNYALIQLKFADALRKEPVLISFLVRMRAIKTSCETIQRICKTAPPNTEQYKIVESLLSNYGGIEPLVLALDGERLLGGEWAFNQLKHGSAADLSADITGEPGLGDVLLSLYSTFFKPLLIADHAAYVRIMDYHTRLAQQPYSLDERNTVEKKVRQMHSRLNWVTSMLVPALGRVKEIYWETIARMRVTRAGLALLQEKKSQGAFPQTLEGVNIKNLDDPFSEEPLHYKLQGQGFIIYSVGPDEKDNNGSPKQKKQNTDWDIVWSYPGEHQELPTK